MRTITVTFDAADDTAAERAFALRNAIDTCDGLPVYDNAAVTLLPDNALDLIRAALGDAIAYRVGDDFDPEEPLDVAYANAYRPLLAAMGGEPGHQVVVLDPTPVVVCETCEDYVDDPRLRTAAEGDEDLYGAGWVHTYTGSSRCPGQEDDDTGDHASPRHTTVGEAFPDGIPA